MESLRALLLVLGIVVLETSTPVHAKPTGIPSYIHVCKRSDPNVDKCIKKSIEDLRPQLIKGIPELNVPPLEPLVLPEVIVSRGSNAANFKATGKNVKVFGAGSFEIQSLSTDLEKHEFNAVITIPRLFFDADYEVDAKILVLPLKGKGPLTANATNVKGDIHMIGSVVDKDGEKYLKFNTIHLKIDMDNYKVHLDGLFGGDKVLGEATNAALNEGNRDFINALTPVIEATTGDILLKIANQITETFTYDQLFPDN
ncbi:putative beta-carotene-binding protein [Hetaerina americana]|uniref:putative beta-carotene-binding protein n=1 Tax=Hetaerina americana TaxID=62018 RepID=UPI003A7F33A0